MGIFVTFGTEEPKLYIKYDDGLDFTHCNLI